MRICCKAVRRLVFVMIIGCLSGVALAATTTIMAPPVPATGITLVPRGSSIAAPPATASEPSIILVAPASLSQGQSYTLFLTGRNFTDRMQVGFGPGIQPTGSLNVLNPANASIGVQVSPSAPPGSRQVVMTYGNITRTGPATIFVMPASQPPVSVMGATAPGAAAAPQPPPPPGAPPPSPMPSPGAEQPGITGIFPNQWVQGNSYSVTVNGKGFVPAMEIGLGDGVQIKGKVKVLTPTLAQMDVAISASAATGQRQAQVRASVQSPWATTQAMAWVMPLTQTMSYGGQMPAPKIVPMTVSLKNFKKGVITLEQPRIIKQEGLKNVAPVLRDDVVFEWKEQNPGTADFFELRILNLSGKVLVRKRIEGAKLRLLGGGGGATLAPPTFYQPEPAFLDELLHVKQQGTVSAAQAAAQNASQKKVASQAKSYAPGGEQNGGQGETQPTWPDNADLLWEVAGYRVYQSNGVLKTAQADVNWMLAAAEQANQSMSDAGAKPALAKTETVEVEVEISDRWSLQRPGSINGFGACPLEKSFEVLNMDSGKGETGKAGVNHPFERWIISGTVDLSKSPYASKPTEIKDPNAKSEILNPNTERQYDNLFVDWGDGSVQPLHLQTQGTFASTMPGPQTYNEEPKPAWPPDFYTHVYQDTGSYNIRVYQLAEKDVQQVNPGGLTDAYDGHGGSPYFILSGRGSAAGGQAKEIAGRAYQLYCRNVNIEPIMDPVASGPLQLQSVAISGFGAKQKVTIQAKGTTGPLSASQAKVLAKAGPGQAAKGTMQLSQAAKAGPVGEGVDATCSACNKAFTARAILKYLGSGEIGATWKVKMKGKQAVQNFPDTGAGHIPASPSRTGDPANWGEPAPGAYELNSPALPVDPADVYEVTVDVWVKPDPPKLISGAILGGMVRGRGSVTGRAVLDNALAGGGGSKPLKVGFLRPYQEGNKSTPPVIYLDNKSLAPVMGAAGQLTRNGALAGAIKLGPPFFVQSAPKKYKVVPSDASKPCEFYFAGQSGDKFPVYLDQDKLQQSSGGVYSGSGTLGARLTTNNSSASDLPVPVSFQNWMVDGQGNVAPGTKLSLSPGQVIHPHALTGSLTKLDGVSGQKMDATLDVKVADSFLRKPGTTEPPGWVATGGLRESGDWTQDKPLSLGGETALGWSGFYIESDNVVLDLSHSQGAAPAGKCQDVGGTSWTGVNFGSAKIKLNTADLVTVKVSTDGWGVTDWICGKLDVANDPKLINLPLGKGKVSFNTVSLTAEPKGAFTANYNMDVQVPWLDTSLHGDITLQSNNQQEGQFEFAGLKPTDDVERDFGPVHMRVPKDSFRFGADPAGWRVIADPEMSFKAEGKPFVDAPVTVADMRFGMNGRAFFDQSGAPSRTIPLGGVGHLGKTNLDLTSLKLTGGSSGNDMLMAAFTGQLRLSQALPAADVQANYKISGDNYAGSGPYTSPFKVQVAFPAGQPSIDAAISPTYAPSPNPGTRYLGSVDLGMFGGPPVKAEFLLGFQGSTDYWLTRATIPLGTSGVAITQFISLYQIRGGLGYHMALDSFKNPASLESAQPDTSQSVLFMAGLRVGSPDQFTYTVDGDLTVSPSSGARMDFHAWLLKSQQTGAGDFLGYFQYAGGDFDGRLWGHLGLLNDAIYFDLGNSEGNAAVDLHFGGGWYINAGKKAGPRIRAHMLVQDSDSYLMLGSDVGLATGGSQQIHLGVGDSSVASAYVDGYMDMGLQITPQPHVAGDFAAGAEAGVCVVGACESMGVTAAVHAEALPVTVRAHATVEFPWPLPDVSFNVHL